jgi:NitT/TauT family transport system substrate-binding protein
LTKKETLQLHKERFEELKKVIDLSIEEIQNDPKASHQLTKKYLHELSYEEFSDSLKTIEWINKPSLDLLEKIEKIGYKKEDLLL